MQSKPSSPILYSLHDFPASKPAVSTANKDRDTTIVMRPRSTCKSQRGSVGSDVDIYNCNKPVQSNPITERGIVADACSFVYPGSEGGEDSLFS